MEPGAAQVFSGMMPEQFARLTARAQAAGIGLSGNSGRASNFGVEIVWNYAPETQKLTVQCLSAPFFMRMGDVDARIAALVKESLG
ncbi:MAG: hypothetical protein ABSE99_13420 [Terracidiphilus sp.]